MRNFFKSMAGIALTLMALASGAATPVAPIPVAHSALLTIDATPTDDGVALHIKHASNQIPIDGQNVTVLVDGKEHPVTPQPDGTFLLATKDVSGDEHQLEITVAHDGIRELLSGKITLPKTVGGTASDLWHDHKQMAWWVLNIAVVLIAVLAISNRKSKPDKPDEDD